jgi:hypothetical protein
MTNTLFILLITCLCPQQAMRMRENSNVLVPSNNVNMQVKIKKLLVDDDFDISELSDNEIAKIDKLDSSKLDKILHKNVPPIHSIDRHSNENHIEDSLRPSNGNEVSNGSTFLEGSTTEAIKKLKMANTNASTEEPPFTENNTIPITFPTYPPFNNTSFAQTTTSNVNNSSTMAGITTTNSFPFVYTTTTNYTNTSTTPTPFTPPNTQSTTQFTTTTKIFATEIPYNESSTFYPDTTTTTKISSTSTERPLESELSIKEECLPGRVQDYLKWVDDKGRLQEQYIRTNFEMQDYNMLDLSHGNEGRVEAMDNRTLLPEVSKKQFQFVITRSACVIIVFLLFFLISKWRD